MTKKITLLTFTIALIVMVTEVCLRFAGLPLEWNYGSGGESGFEKSLHIASSYPGLVYEMKPAAEIDMDGIQVKTNHLGFRGPELSPVKAESSKRIVVLGDSITFGFGVEQDEPPRMV